MGAAQEEQRSVYWAQAGYSHRRHNYASVCACASEVYGSVFVCVQTAIAAQRLCTRMLAIGSCTSEERDAMLHCCSSHMFVQTFYIHV